MKNYEGYHDPTAGMAMRESLPEKSAVVTPHRKTHKKKNKPKSEKKKTQYYAQPVYTTQYYKK